MKRVLTTMILLLFSTVAYGEEFPRYPEKIPSGSLIEQLQSEGALGAAPTNRQLRALPSLARDLIKHFEGWRSTAYNDSAKYCTIGQAAFRRADRKATVHRVAASMNKQIVAHLLTSDPPPVLMSQPSFLRPTAQKPPGLSNFT